MAFRFEKMSAPLENSSSPSLKDFESASLEQLSKLTSSVDFISALSAADLDKPIKEKLGLLHSYGKAFEKGYYYQSELNTKLRSHLEFKEKEYLQHEEQNKELKARIQEQKKEIRRLEDLVIQLAKQRDKYKAKCKKLSGTLKELSQSFSKKQSQSSFTKDGNSPFDSSKGSVSPFESSSSRNNLSSRDSQDFDSISEKSKQETQPETISQRPSDMKVKLNLPQVLEPIKESSKEHKEHDSSEMYARKKGLKLNLIQASKFNANDQYDTNGNQLETLEDGDYKEAASPELIKDLYERIQKIEPSKRSSVDVINPKIIPFGK